MTIWVLNLDAEEELASPGRYEPTRHVRELVRRQSARLLGTLVRPDDLVLGDGDLRPDDTAGHSSDVRVWSPTPRALERIAATGLPIPEAPDVDVLRRVNARPFAGDVRAGLGHSSFAKRTATTLDEALALVALPASDGWLVRRTFGAAGRGRRRLRAGRPDPGEHAWLVASLRLGPVTVEPWVQVVREFTRSGWVERDGGVRGSGPCEQGTTRTGAWLGSRALRGADVAREHDAALERALHAVGSALADAGYFGPFGIDAYLHRAPGGAVLNPISEINARYTMDWCTADPGAVETPRFVHAR